MWSDATTDDLYETMDWLLTPQAAIPPGAQKLECLGCCVM